MAFDMLSNSVSTSGTAKYLFQKPIATQMKMGIFANAQRLAHEKHSRRRPKTVTIVVKKCPIFPCFDRKRKKLHSSQL
jgi:hypothetical protein